LVCHADTLFNFVAEFVDGLALRHPNEPITRTHDTPLGATQQLAVKLHYLVAQDPHGELPRTRLPAALGSGSSAPLGRP
jgi:hypothetical protein